jgi:hypothetical protein
VLDDLKQLCLYTDCIGAGKWITPLLVSAVEIAPYLLIMARVLANGSRVSEKELELWRQHLLPVKHASFEDNKRAVARWYADMRAHGLSAATEEEIESFLRSMKTH